MRAVYNTCIPKTDKNSNLKFGVWDSATGKFVSEYRYRTKKECQEHCDFYNLQREDDNGNIFFDRSQWKNWEGINAIAKRVHCDGENGIPYIDTQMKKNIVPNLFNRIYAYWGNGITDEEYSRFYVLLSMECK